MLRYPIAALAATAFALVSVGPALQAQEEARPIEDGGVHVDGWMGRIDASEAARGGMLEHSRLAREGGGLHVATGPAVVYWNPANTAAGSYTVSATFHEAAYMNRNNHPHPYGIFIGGDAMGTDGQSYLDCAAYGNGSFIVRGFGPDPFQMNGRRGQAHDAVNKAAGQGEPVTQEIAVTVTEATVSCSINGTQVASYPKADVVGGGKLTSTDGVYGIRFGHNTEATVSNFSKM
jgi:hypothetical protein